MKLGEKIMSDLYKKAGVDVEKGYEAVERMKKHIARTTRSEVIGEVEADISFTSRTTENRIILIHD